MAIMVKKAAKKKSAVKGKKKKVTSKVVLISAHAKKTRAEGEEWPAALRRSTSELVAAGKI